MEKEYVFSKETMIEFANLVDGKKINLVGIGDMQKEHLVEIAVKLGLEKVRTKSLEMLRKEIGHLGKLSLAGQVITVYSIHTQDLISLKLVGTMSQLHPQKRSNRGLDRCLLSTYLQDWIQAPRCSRNRI